ncbi:unnamed protein product [[Actinomadura] parvosata subsp. kistnae]|uniref:Uncharacterized protein n=1 Tax=[Actinomadura] parvosata subsp. kistnae TaxID=1909395 RepID=A0A1U9ZTX1_9ACTN|nr:hypothetical protein [Nonomuraea sp. ATCC 55076]AQZ61407.1 hypothetical protein BKM31_07895 [Nonomuraea sp. ATCC 55076]SPL98094.1 unnamed protein product [Actinomadura parvosata subsp. kistnae]
MIVNLVLAAALTATTLTPATPAATERVLRVYSNNIENLVRNNPDGTCTRISGPDHLTSMLVDDAGATGTSGVRAPDLLIVQQVRGTGQATAYADQLSAKFGHPAGTYKAIVAWDDPEPWGGSHHCSQQELGDLKKKQTNAILYNTRTLSLAATSKYWSAGWLKPGTAYDNGAGCTLYKPPSNDDGATYAYKWKRTSAIAAKFTIRETGTTVFAATMHLPEQNGKNACAGAGDTGIAGSGIHVGADATSLMNSSAIRVIGIDANRTGIGPATLGGFGMTGYGAKATMGTKKIDYLFVKGTVLPSSVDHTVSGTKSNHLALYGFISY